MKKEWIDNETLEGLSKYALNCIFSLWDGKSKTFWRSTSHKERTPADSTDFFPTVSFKCVDALITIISEYPELLTKAQKTKITSEIIPKIISLDLYNINSSLDQENETSDPAVQAATPQKKELNEFTLSIYIQALSRINKISEGQPATFNKANQQLVKAVTLLVNHSYMDKYKNNDQFRDHPFISFHVIRAFFLARPFLKEGNLCTDLSSLIKKVITSIKTTCEYLLSKYQLGSITPSDSVALSFCSAALSLDSAIENRKYIIAALKVAISSQDAVGGWPMGRLVHKNKDIEAPHLETSTYEIAWALTTAVHDILLNHGLEFEIDMMDDIYCKLEKSIGYAERSLVKIEAENMTGWCSDHPYDFQLIESWTSSNVLLFICWMKKIKEAHEQEIVFKSFLVTYPNGKTWQDWLKWDIYKNDSEVSSDNPVLVYLEESFINPILQDAQKLPSADNNTVSGLLFGPPGTSKTTIVKAIAGALNWPILMLSPGNFIEGGLESIERVSQNVFNKLKKLSRVVVLFDECDELFRDRVPSDASEQTRGITAFITASMLPKLQDLHDNGRVIFFICTNNFETIDPAIKRGGRIDHILGVGPPDSKCRKKILEKACINIFQKLGKTAPPYWDEVLEAISSHTNRFTRPELLRVAKEIINKLTYSDSKSDVKTVSSVIKDFEKSLTITADEYTKFDKQNKDFSHAIIGK